MMFLTKNNLMKTYLNKIITIIIALIVAILFPKIAYILADYFGEVIGYKQFSTGWDFMHHGIQMLLALSIMILPFWNKSFQEWGFNNWEKEKNKIIIIKFTLGFLIFFTIGKIIYLWLNNWPSALYFNVDEFNVLGKIIFSFTMPGLSEEILFRALVMGILMIAWQKSINIGKVKVPIAGIISSLIFVIAHIGFSIFPFRIIYYNIGQLIFAFMFGIFYSIIYVETRSLLAPMIIHNVIDGLGTVIDYILTILFI